MEVFTKLCRKKIFFGSNSVTRNICNHLIWPLIQVNLTIRFIDTTILICKTLTYFRIWTKTKSYTNLLYYTTIHDEGKHISFINLLTTLCLYILVSKRDAWRHSNIWLTIILFSTSLFYLQVCLFLKLHEKTLRSDVLLFLLFIVVSFYNTYDIHTQHTTWWMQHHLTSPLPPHSHWCPSLLVRG